MSRPMLRVVKGDPAPEDLAALVAVVSARSAAARSAGATGGQKSPRSAWADRGALVRQPLPRGPAAWRNSTRPR
ncbi:MAG: acyl-CoA carboxylase subunit epsilon [Propionibacteriales bacterium]|nr:acyl-CoA carboxylase subunit epsilon [Propionibacteriales bacterium]